MTPFFMSPYSVPIAGIALAALAVVTSALVKISRARYQNQGVPEAFEEAFREEMAGLRKRVEALEAIVVDLDKRI